MLGKGYYTVGGPSFERRWPRLGEATSAVSMPGSSARGGGVGSGFGAWEIGWTPLEAGDEVGHLLNHALERPRPLRPNRTPSRQCQGTAFCHLRNAGSQEGLAVLHHRLDQGGNFFDSAQANG